MTDDSIKDYRETQHPAYEAINWNTAPELESDIWNKLVQQFWVPEKIPVSNDLKSWEKLHENEQKLVLKVFTGLTMLDTIQSRFGAPSITRDATSLFEESVYSNIIFMESVHARSYSRIFSTLSNTPDINAAFRWSEENDYLRKKAEIVMGHYRSTSLDPMDHQRKKIVSVFLESFLFYSGFYLPLWLNGQAKLTNTADIVRLIIKDESIHGYYIGAKFQEVMRTLTQDQRNELNEWAYDILDELMDNEIRYTQDLYDEVGLTTEVKAFLRYNANRALANLGFDPLYGKENLNPVILNGMDLTQENHDFFSGGGNAYTKDVKEEKPLDDEDFDW